MQTLQEGTFFCSSFGGSPGGKPGGQPGGWPKTSKLGCGPEWCTGGLSLLPVAGRGWPHQAPGVTFTFFRWARAVRLELSGAMPLFTF
jgi:hypothetical protein